MARASALQAEGHRFDSDILHTGTPGGRSNGRSPLNGQSPFKIKSPAEDHAVIRSGGRKPKRKEEAARGRAVLYLLEDDVTAR